MARHYRHPNKRIEHRTAGGQFRTSTLADVGMMVCEVCGGLRPIVLPEGPFIDPRDVAAAKRVCAECREETK